MAPNSIVYYISNYLFMKRLIAGFREDYNGNPKIFLFIPFIGKELNNLNERVCLCVMF